MIGSCCRNWISAGPGICTCSACGLLASQARYVIDKNPQNLFNLPIILQALPNARVLCLRRDPMDACFSNLKELFQGDAYPYSYALDDLAEHCLRVRSWMEHWQSVAPQSVRIVDYENVVKDPDATIAARARFCRAGDARRTARHHAQQRARLHGQQQPGAGKHPCAWHRRLAAL